MLRTVTEILKTGGEEEERGTFQAVNMWAMTDIEEVREGKLISGEGFYNTRDDCNARLKRGS